MEESLLELKEVIRQKKEQAYALAKELYLECTYSVFNSANKAAEKYNILLEKLKAEHTVYLRSVEDLSSLAEQFESVMADMDEILYDIGRIEKELKNNQIEYDSVQEQLKLTDYEEIKERLDQCVKWLNEYPMLLEKCVTEKTEMKEQLQQHNQYMERCRVQIEEYEKKQSRLEKCFGAELRLGYVTVSEELGANAKKICECLESEAKGMNKNDIIQKCIKDSGVKDLKRIVMVGDTEHDALGAEKVGVDFIGVTFGFGFQNMNAHSPQDRQIRK